MTGQDRNSDTLHEDLDNPRWVVRILKNNKRLRPCKTFADFQYDGQKKALLAAIKFRDNLIAKLPKNVASTLRDGSPKHKPNGGVLLCKRKIAGSRYYAYYYVAKCWNKYTKKMLKKSFSISSSRTKEEAHKLAKKKRKEFVGLVALEAKQLGL